MLTNLSADIICSENRSRTSSFPRAKLEEICKLGRTDNDDNVQREISEHIFQVKWKQEKLFLLMDVILFIILELK